MMNVNILDILVLLYLVLALVDGWRRGVYTLFNILALVLAGLFAKFWYVFMLSFLNSAFDFETAIQKYVSDLVATDPKNIKIFSQFLGLSGNVSVPDVAHKIAVLLAISISFIAAYIVLRIIFLFFSGTASEMLSMKLLGVLVHLIIAVFVVVVVFDILWAFSFQIDGLRHLMLTSKVWPIVTYINAILLSLI